MTWWLAAESQDLIRPYLSLDIDDVIAIVVSFTALIGLFVWRKSFNKTEAKTDAHTVTETVDDSVLGRFEELFEKVTALEKDLLLTKKALADTESLLQQALAQIAELKRLEEYLQAKLHEKDAEILTLRDEKSNNEREIRGLKAALGRAEERIEHLERACRERVEKPE